MGSQCHSLFGIFPQSDSHSLPDWHLQEFYTKWYYLLPRARNERLRCLIVGLEGPILFYAPGVFLVICVAEPLHDFLTDRSLPGFDNTFLPAFHSLIVFLAYGNTYRVADFMN